MYGNLPPALLPATGNGGPLLIAAVGLIAVGTIVMAVSAVMARKQNQA